MPQNPHVKNWKTMLGGAEIAAGKAPAEKSVSKPASAAPKAPAASERRRGASYGKDVTLPTKTANFPAYSESYRYDWRSRNNLKRGRDA